MPKGNEYILMD